MGRHTASGALQGVFLAALLVLGLGWLQASFAYNPGDPEFRAIYADAWQDGFKTPDQINQLISDAHYCNANTIVVQVRRRGDTVYPSIEPTCSGFSSSFDCLADLIQKAHTTSPRLDVQAWFVVWPIASATAPPSNPNHPYNKYPQYLTKDGSGNTNISGDYWFDPGNPNAEQYTYNLIMDVVNRYNVDGINFDYIRYGGMLAGYNDVSVARFNAASARYGGDFSAWRRDQVTNFVRKVYANAIAVKPNIKITADCYGGSPAPADLAAFPGTQAYSKFFQNFPAWLQEGILDMGMTMTYFDCAGDYAGLFNPWVCFMSNYHYNRQSAVLPGVYSPSCLYDQLTAARNLPCGHPDGAGVYSYHLLDPDDMTVVRQVWNTSAPIPTMTWKASPTKGHVKGNVTFAGSVWIDGAYVRLQGPGVDRSMYADGTGFYAFIDVTPGDYTITCSANGYGNIVHACHVTAGAVTSVDCDYPISSLIISNVQANESQTSAIVTWTTNAGASSKVYYGLDRTCSSSTTEDATQVTSHSVNLTGLQAGRTYYYRVYSKNPGADAAMSSIYALVTKPATPADIIIDNGAASFVGSWSIGTSAGDKYGADYMTAYGNDGTKTATYTPNIITPGTYKVWEWHPAGSNRDNNVPYTVTYNGGSYTYYVNEQVSGGTWNLLGSHPFAAGTAGRVAINNAASGGTVAIADAIKFSWGVTDTTVPTTPTDLAASNVQDDSVTLNWTASTDNVSVAGYRIHRGTSATTSVIDSSPTNSYTDTYVSPNTRYWYAVSAYDSSGNKSGTTATINLWTQCPKPTSATVTCDKQAGIWQSSGPFTFTAVGGFGPGFVNYYRYAWDTSPSHEWTDTESTWVVGTKALTAVSSALPYYLHIKGYNQIAQPGEPSDLGPYYLDTTAPETPTVTDEKYTTSTDTLVASWSANDPESGVTEYQYAVGSSVGGNEVKDWTSAGTDTSATITGLSLNPGTPYYISVRAVNGAGLISATASSAGVLVAQSVASIQAAKDVADHTAIALPARIVTAAFPTVFYIEEEDRVSGIRVELANSLEQNQIVTVLGKIDTAANGERAIVDPVVVDDTPEYGTAIAPFGLTTKAAAGKAIPGVKGVDNTGLLVKVAGEVKSVVGDGFYLDDGSSLSDNEGAGIKIWTGTAGSAVVGDHKTVTGVVSLRKPGSTVYPQILKRDMAP